MITFFSPTKPLRNSDRPQIRDLVVTFYLVSLFRHFQLQGTKNGPHTRFKEQFQITNRHPSILATYKGSIPDTCDGDFTNEPLSSYLPYLLDLVRCVAH